MHDYSKARGDSNANRLDKKRKNNELFTRKPRKRNNENCMDD